MPPSDLALPDPIRLFVDATNAGDRDRFVAAFAANAVLNDWGREFVGRAGVAQWNETDNIGRHASFTVHGVTPTETPDEYDLDVSVGGGGFNGRSTLRFTLEAGVIRRLVITG